ncbi:MAG: glycosyl hydrolase [Lentisphaerae bacterium]|nr:glycosyl hydrolase [Lentisphaerota bacterium]
MKIRESLKPSDLAAAAGRFWRLSGEKILRIARRYDPAAGAPVFTVRGLYTARGWTDWTRGFQHGSALLQFEATGDAAFLDLGRDGTFAQMDGHVTHFGVHDHGFNCVSTHGALWRMMNAGRIPEDAAERRHLELALKASGCVQARRWTDLGGGAGFVHSFNGPHSLFADTIRSMRSLALAHRLGAAFHGEQDRRESLLVRLVAHLRATAEFAVYHGAGRDAYDVSGRVAHESLFNPVNGSYRCPGTQQGWSPFTTWTRGLAWVILGFAEQLEFLATLDPAELEPCGGAAAVDAMALRAARATADFYIANTAADGIPPWDTGAPALAGLGDWRARASEPLNDGEPFDSSAAAIAAQGLMRLGRVLAARGEGAAGARYMAAGLTVLDTLLRSPYLSEAPAHEGLILHAVYHRPNGWDHVPEGRRIPCGESGLWGDYHAREAVLLAQRIAGGGDLVFFR